MMLMGSRLLFSPLGAEERKEAPEERPGETTPRARGRRHQHCRRPRAQFQPW